MGKGSRLTGLEIILPEGRFRRSPRSRAPGSWRPAPLTAFFLVTILSSLRAIRAISSSLPITTSVAAGCAGCAAQPDLGRRRLDPRSKPPPGGRVHHYKKSLRPRDHNSQTTARPVACGPLEKIVP